MPGDPEMTTHEPGKVHAGCLHAARAQWGNSPASNKDDYDTHDGKCVGLLFTSRGGEQVGGRGNRI